MPRRKKGSLKRLVSKGISRLKSITVNAGILSLTFETSKKSRSGRRRKVTIKAPLPEAQRLNPIQAAFLSKIADAKRQAESNNDRDGIFGLNLLEYYVKDPKGFNRYLRDLDRLELE